MAPARKTTAEKGLDWRRHRYAADNLKRNHVDGTPCDWCHRPMYSDRTRNWDYKPDASELSGVLHADHSKMSRAEAIRLGIPIPPPDRLLHGTCNIQRGDGGNDHLASGLQPAPAEQLLMPWPWLAGVA